MFTSGKGFINLTNIWRTVFALGLCYTLYFFVLNPSAITVETDLKTISPTLSSNPAIATALEDMANFGGLRIMLLVQSNDQHALQKAKENLETVIAGSRKLSVVSDESTQSSLIEALKPYRFGLLTPRQRESLIDHSIAEIANSERRKLYRLGSDFRLVPFEEDPLAWFSEYLTEAFGQLKKTSSDAEQSGLFTEAVSLSITPSLNGMQAQTALIEELNAAIASTSQQHHVEIFKSGVIFFAQDAAIKSKADIQVIAVTSGLAILVLMILVFKSLTPITVAFISIAVGVAFAMSVTLNLYGKIHILTIVFGTSLVGIVIDYSLHNFSHQFAHSKVKNASFSALNKAMLLSMVTSFIGFGALAFSGIEALTKVATFSCAGLVMAWLTVMSLGSLPSRRSNRILNTSMAQWILQLRVSQPERKLLYLVLASVAGLAYLMLFGVRGSDDPRLFFEPSENLLQQERVIAQNSASFETNEFLIVKANSVAELYSSLEALYQYAQVSNVQLFSIADWLPSPQTQSENHQLQGKLYGPDGAAKQVFSSLGVPASKIDAALTDYLNQSAKNLSPAELQARLPWLPPMWHEYNQQYFANVIFMKGAETSAIKEWSKINSGVSYISMTNFARDALAQQRQSATLLLVLAYVLVAALWLAYYRSFAALAYLIIPAGATIITLILLPIVGQPITIFHLMALFLVLGLGMDYIVFTKEMQQHDAITLQAILLSAGTSLLSFGLLSFSSMPVVKAFGSTVLVGNALNLIATIILFTIKTQERK